jgi:hypothetical protein
MNSKLFLFFTLLLSTGCSTGTGLFQQSSLEVHSMGLSRSVLYADCPTIVCTDGFANEGDIWMTNIPLEQLASGNFNDGQIIHFQVLWTPVAGKTPLASTSTNVTIRHIIISNGVVGTYGGGGYCWKSGNPKDGISLYLEEATMAIQNKTPGFDDLLSPATMVGRVSSVPNKQVAQQISNAVDRIIQ